MHHLATGESEVSDLVLPSLQQDVGGFQIAMDDVEAPQVTKALADLPEHIQYFPLPLRTLLLIAALQQVPEVASLAILGHDVEISVILGMNVGVLGRHPRIRRCWGVSTV